MVKKRNRNKKSFRDTYESDDNDSDVEMNLDSPPPPPKRYGLRQRKQPIFFPDYECDEDADDPDAVLNNTHSDDDEYDVKKDLPVVKKKISQSTAKGTTTTTTTTTRNNNQKEYNNDNNDNNDDDNDDDHDVNEVVKNIVMDNCHQNDSNMGGDVSVESNDLIDFEDVIRADVVVNTQLAEAETVRSSKSKKLNAHLNNFTQSGSSITSRIKVRRNKKRKSNLDDMFDVTLSTDSPDPKPSEEDDTPIEVQIDPSTLIHQRDESESDDDKPLSKRRRNVNGVSAKKTTNALSKHNNNSNSDSSKERNKITLVASWVDKIEKYVPPNLEENEREVFLSNEYLLANAFDVGADEFRENQEKIMELPKDDSESEFPFDFESNGIELENLDDEDSSDDVVIIEKKPEIIVLDDD